jgi:hypothetical protein
MNRACVPAVVLVLLLSCFPNSFGGPDKSDQNSIVGTWLLGGDIPSFLIFEFKPDHTFRILGIHDANAGSGTFKMEDSVMCEGKFQIVGNGRIRLNPSKGTFGGMATGGFNGLLGGYEFGFKKKTENFEGKQTETLSLDLMQNVQLLAVDPKFIEKFFGKIDINK